MQDGNLKVTNVSTGAARKSPQQMVIDDATPTRTVQTEQQVQQTQVQQPQPSPIDAITKLQHDLDQLTKVGKIEEEHIIFGFKFRMATLPAKQNTEVLEVVAGVDDNDTKFSMMKYHLLGRAIQSINGVPLEGLYKGDDNKSNLQKRVDIVSSWQQTFVNAIFDKYDDMVARSDKANKEEVALKN